MVQIRLPSELQARVDAARGGVARERFVRSLIEEALAVREGRGAQAVAQHGARVPSVVPSSVARAGARPSPKAPKR